jgi:hypothetical protein
MNHLFDVGEKKKKSKPKKQTIENKSIEQLKEIMNGDDATLASEASKLMEAKLRGVDDRKFDPSIYAYYEDVVGE